MFELDLMKAVDTHDVLVRMCVTGAFGFWECCMTYDDF